jgi:hypothetical protein
MFQFWIPAQATPTGLSGTAMDQHPFCDAGLSEKCCFTVDRCRQVGHLFGSSKEKFFLP